MTLSIHVGISEVPISIEKAMDFVNAPENGATNMFIGRVRNYNLGRVVNAVSYDAFSPLTTTVFEKICSEAILEFDPQLQCYIQHYKGKLEIGGISVVIAVSSPHRDDSFKAARYLIEELKKRAPIWKQEHYVDGDSMGTRTCSLWARP